MANPQSTHTERAYNLEQELDLLDPKELRLYLDTFGDLEVELEGRTYKQITAVRAFPVSSDDRFIILKDAEDKELGIIQNAGELDGKSRKVLRAELARAYFTPRIVMVNEITEQFHIPKWDVETDRGPRVFELRTSRDVRVLDGGRILFRDADGNRYEIPDYRNLDPISRAMVESQI